MILRRPAPPEWPERHHRVCFLGTVRYAAPLDPSRARQWERLADLGAMFIVGFSGRWGARRFTEHGRFYLLPTPPAAVLRYLVMAIGGTAITAWLVARRGVDLVVAQSPYEGCAAAVAIRLAGWLGHQAGLIVESHGDFEEAVFLQRRVGFPRLQRALMRVAARFAVRRADALRAVSSSTEAQLVRLAPATPIVRFPTWTDLDVFVRAGDRGDSRSAVILYAGRLTPLKGVDRLLDAFERVGREIPDARLWITGQAVDGGYARALADRARRSTLAAVAASGTSGRRRWS